MTISGIGVSPGIAIGKARVIKKQAVVLTGILLLNDEEITIAIEKFDKAVAVSVIEVEMMMNNHDALQGSEGVEILEAHIELLGDPQIREDVVEKIQTERKNVNDAVIEVIQAAVEVFKSMDDDYMSARAADIEDIGNRIVKNLTPAIAIDQDYEAGTIIIAEDLAPSDTISMDIAKIAGFATQIGGKTSHAAIIAKSRGIPAVVGCGADLKSVQDGDMLILDGQSGSIIIDPDQETILKFEAKRDSWLKELSLLKSLKDTPAKTIDGTEIHLFANIADSAEMENALEFGAQGSGLFRTEFLFLGRNDFPSEEEQFEFYKAVALKAKGKPITVRTLDIGGDKQLAYFNFPEEQNPFLGYRAIRLCLDKKDIFITQLKAILRASEFGKLKIMFPMIATVNEIRAAKAILKEAMQTLTDQGTAFDKAIKIGIMIEIPSAAVIADLLAKEVDFFSIGTNDLTQYTLAVDRMNEKIKDLYDPFDPGVLRLIANVIEQRHKNHIEVGMCGELASDPRATFLLIGMGLTEFSMSASSIPVVKNKIIKASLTEARKVYEAVMQMDNSKDITNYLQEKTQ
ncbi:MAG: phosphoenolpyruvate--protein phosphotransferase [Bacteroidetes bacterium]|jgi:phosphotransferase system enzyme I (PtsI)|nr:phosphoenolpyruvate--protein phosphotransferase [Bacteroidota bacterium]